MTKITLTREQESDLKSALHLFDYVEIDLIRAIVTNKLDEYGYQDLLALPQKQIVKAILNGYEVQKTKEDRAREYIKDLQDSLSCDKMNGEPYSPYQFALEAVEIMLNILEIKL